MLLGDINVQFIIKFLTQTAVLIIVTQRQQSLLKCSTNGIVFPVFPLCFLFGIVL